MKQTIKDKKINNVPSVSLLISDLIVSPFEGSPFSMRESFN